MTQSIDYIVVGGGLGGSVVATRLAEHDTTLIVLVIEAGSDVSNHPLTSEPLAAFQAHFSPLDWAYTTTPQTHLDNRSCYNSAGKGLGGGTAVNYATWTRGPREDYDDWASLVGDKRWSYDGLLPYFKRTESCQDKPTKESADQHGFDGPISNIRISQSNEKRIYPLREPLLRAWKSLGIEYNEDANDGHAQGIAETRENWKNGKRQIASEAYGLKNLSNITVKTDTVVRRVLIEDTTNGKKAVGVELANGEQIKARKEVIISCGGYRTPQVLLLSGIGPTDELKRHGITQHKDLPVGKNFYDHVSVNQFWKLKHPEQGLAVGTPLWSDPAYGFGVPNDFLITTSVPHQSIKSALEKDGNTKSLSLLEPNRGHLETIIAYAPAGAQIQNTPVPFDGTHIASAVLG
jgi:choline dehydrogenase-like flavoprotein